MAGAARRNGPYAPLGANYADDDAITMLDLAADDRTELLYLRSLAYCARDPRTEGFVSDVALRAGRVLNRALKRGSDTIQASADRLVELGLWDREDGGYRVSAWLKWNKSWSEIDVSRAYDNSRKAALNPEVRALVYARDGNACVHCGSTENLSIDHIKSLAQGGTHDLENLQTLCKSCNSSKGAQQPRPSARRARSQRGTSAEAAPTEPGVVTPRHVTARHGTTQQEETSGKPDAPPRLDVEQVCQAVVAAEVHKGNKKPTVTKAWRTEARLMLDRDGRALADVLDIIEWTKDHTFWRGNIKSVQKLREQFDTLRLQKQSERGRPNRDSTGRPCPPGQESLEPFMRFREVNL